jgi:hypothetical protein
MNGPKTITAEYIQVFKLETAVAGGTLTLSPPGGSYDAGTVVTATATPNQGGQFDGWNGSLEGTTTPIATLTMNGPKSISPRFKYISTLTTPGANSWIIPDGVSSLAIQAWGGGGAGGTASAARTNTNNTQARGGGGAGGGFASTTFVVTPGQTLNYSVGAGGIAPAQAISNGTDSTAGSDTTASIDTTNIVTARGGNGGKNVRSLNSNISGTGGTAPIDNYLGTTTYLGGSGATSNSNGTGGGGGSAGSTGTGGTAPAPANGVSPAGSAGTGGGAAGGAGHNSTANGNPGGTPGAGGSGGAVRSPSQITPETYTHRSGGSGADGQMIIIYTASATPPAVPGVPQSPVPTLSCTLINNNTEVELRWPLSASQWRLYSYDITQTNPWIEIPPALYQSDANGFFWRTTAAAASDFDFCLIKP